MPRLHPVAPDAMSARQREIHDTIAAGPRGQVRGPLAVWLHRPELADRAQALGRYCRYDTLLSPRLSELAILVTARVWSAEFEWQAHKPIALEAGLAPALVDAIRDGARPAFASEEEEVVHDFAFALHREHHVPPDLYETAVAVLGKDRVVDLTGLLGYYGLISMTINVFEVDPIDPHGREMGPPSDAAAKG